MEQLRELRRHLGSGRQHPVNAARRWDNDDVWNVDGIANGAGAGALYLSKNELDSPSNVESALKNAAKTTTNKSKNGVTIKRLHVGGM